MDPIHPMIVTIDRAKRRFTKARGSRATTRSPRLSRTAQSVKVPIRRRSTTIRVSTAGLPDDQGRNASTEAVAIEQHVPDTGRTCVIRNIVEITSGVGEVLIDGRGHDLMFQ